MTDKELLELAAKAAGIEGKWERDPNFKQERWHFNVPYDNHNMLTGFEWNPLKDDGDALRLAVKLDMSIAPAGKDISVCVGYGRWNEVAIKNDPYAATRRAIVKAAAEIGKDMK